MPKLIKRSSSVSIDIPDDFASLRRIKTDKKGKITYVYEFNFNIDQINAANVGISDAKLMIYLDPPRRDSSLFFKDHDRDLSIDTVGNVKRRPSSTKSPRIKTARKAAKNQIILNLQSRSSLRKDSRNKRKSSAVLTTKIDTTAFISNSKVSKFASLSRSASLAALQPKRKMKLQSIGQIKQSNKKRPILQVKNRFPSRASSKMPQSTAVSLILNHAIDPATVYINRSRVQPSMRAISGLVKKRTSRLKAPKSAINSMLVLDRIRIDTVNKRPSLADDDKIPVFKKQVDPNVNVKKTVLIDDDILRGRASFFVKFQFENERGANIVRTKSVKHSRQVRAINTPRRKPQLQVAPYRRPGKNVIEIKQLDETSRQIDIFRRTIERTKRLSESSFKKIGTVNISKKDGTKKFIDLVDNSKTQMYRAVPIGPGGEIGIRFESAVAPALPIRGSKKRQTINNVSLMTELTQQGIEINLSKFPAGPIAAKIMRRNTTLHEKHYKVINDPQPVRLIRATDETMTFLSTDLKEDNIYQFIAVLIYEDGDEEFSAQTSEIIYDAVKTGVVETNVSSVSVNEISSGKFNAVFDINTVVVPGKLDIIKRALENQDLLAEFQDQLKEERDQLQRLITHTVTRTDMSNGETVNLGLFVSGQFNDTRAGKLRRAPPLRSGRSYRYTISPQLRSAETMFDKLVVTKQDAATGRNYSYKPSKFRNPFVIRKGTLASAGIGSRITAKNQFEMGAVGSPYYLTVNVPKNEPEVRSLTASQIDRDTVEVSWSVAGDVSQVDFFIVQAVKLDEIEFIGAAHNISNVSTFRFYDELEESDQEIQYRVIMVNNDFSRSKVFLSNKVEV